MGHARVGWGGVGWVSRGGVGFGGSCKSGWGGVVKHKYSNTIFELLT